MKSDLEEIIPHNISKIVDEHNRLCIEHVDKEQYQGYSCNISKDTDKHNETCLEYVNIGE